MADTPAGAYAPLTLVPGSRRALRVLPGTYRSRRNHGAWMLGTELATIYSTHREGGAPSVLMMVGNGALQLTGGMTPSQARAMARALVAAAEAIDRHVIGAAAGHAARIAGQNHDAIRAPLAAVSAVPAQVSADLPCALPGLWREEGGLDDLVRLDIPAVTPGMVVVAKASEDWFRQPHLRWQTWPDLLMPSTGTAKGGSQ